MVQVTVTVRTEYVLQFAIPDARLQLTLKFANHYHDRSRSWFDHTKFVTSGLPVAL